MGTKMNKDKEFIDKMWKENNIEFPDHLDRIELAVDKEDYYKSIQHTITTVRKSYEVDEETVREPIENALYSTGKFTTEDCTELAKGILQYINEHGLKVINPTTPIQEEL